MQQHYHLSANGERREKKEKSMGAIPPHRLNFKEQVTHEPLINTWPQGGGGAEPPHISPKGRESMDCKHADPGTTNPRPVTDRRLAQHTTPSGTSPTNTGAELCAPVPTWEEQQGHGFFNILAKNCRGLTSSDRLDELLIELEGQGWDIAFLNETWRTEQEELWRTEQDHIFGASGHESGRRGVGILLHKRWREHLIAFKPVSERICYLDVKIAGVRYRFVSVYFPDSTYSDMEVQKVYDELSEIVEDARERNTDLL